MEHPMLPVSLMNFPKGYNMLKLLPLIMALSTNASALSYTSHFNLAKPTTGDTNYVTPFNMGMDTIDTQLYGLQVATSTQLLPLTGGTLTGPLTLEGSSLTVTGNAFSVGTSTFVVQGGLVGINGNPATSVSPLQITANTNHRNLSIIENTGGEGWQLGIDADGDLNFENSGSASGISFDDDNSVKVAGGSFSVGTSTFVVTGGKVGVGVAAPLGPLHINGGDNSVSFTQPSLLLGYSTTGILPQYIHTRHNSGGSGSNAIDFYTNSGSVGTFATAVHGLTITNGSVGIGTTSPASKVDISSGTIRMAGTGSPAKGAALCLTAEGVMGTCTAGTFDACTCTP